MKKLLFSFLTFTILLAAGNVKAADMSSDPTSDEMIDALKPSESSGDYKPKFRAIRPTQGQNNNSMQQAQEEMKPKAPKLALTVNFKVNSAELTPGAKKMLDELGTALNSSELEEFAFEISGHTDATGSEDYNKMLSEKRADSVKEYLVSNFGIEKERLKAVGKGEAELADEANPAARANRRVEILNLGSK